MKKSSFGYKALLRSADLNQRFGDLFGGSILNGFRLHKGTSQFAVSVRRDNDEASVLLTPEGIRLEETEDVIDAFTLRPNTATGDRFDVIYANYADKGENATFRYEVIEGVPGQAVDVWKTSNIRMALGYVKVKKDQELAEADFVSLQMGMRTKTLIYERFLTLPDGLNAKFLQVEGKPVATEALVTQKTEELKGVLASKATVEALATSLGSGGPKGVFATLAELQNAKPTGDSNIYLVTADGKWYFWNTSAWVAGGVYQSVGIANNSITKDMTTFITKSSNLFNNTSPNIVEDKYIDSESVTESILVSTTTFITDFVDVKAGDVIRVPVVANILTRKMGAFYDENKQFISGIAIGSVTELNGVRTVVVPAVSNIKYIRLNGRDNTTTVFYRDTFMIVKNMAYPSSYIPHALPMLTEEFGLNSRQREEVAKAVSETVTLNKNPLYNKIAVFLGDSISVGVGEAVRTAWAGRIGPNNNLVYTNYAVAGATVAAETYSGSTPRTWLCRKVQSMRQDADYVILQGGINDKLNNVPLGSITPDYSSTLDETTFCGAFESLLKQCIEKYIGKKIGYIVTYKVENRHYPYGASTPQSEVYFNKAKEICEKWSIPYLDLYSESGITVNIQSVKDALMPDGIHVNEAGYNLITPKIESWMKKL